MFHNLLTEKIVRATRADGTQVCLSLPGVYEALREIVSFPALRPHQRHAWHAFLCQLGVMVKETSGKSYPPKNEEKWRQCLRKLTKEYSDDAPWCLIVEDSKKPAFMQPLEAPVKDDVNSPDELDSNIVTSKNHDVKQSVARSSMLDDWLFALISLQTMIGFSGRGNYGIARMNGGLSSRCCFGLQSDKEALGERIFQDIDGMLNQMDALCKKYNYKKDGLRLLWLKAWNKDESLKMNELHPYFIEICRRIRLEKNGDSVIGKRGISKKPRVHAKELKGNTGDFWAPITADGTQSLTVSKGSFGYRKLSEYLFNPEKWQLPQSILSCKNEKNMQIIVQGMVGGQGKTEGYYERKIPFTIKTRRMLHGDGREEYAKLAEEQVHDIDEVIGIMRGAIRLLKSEPSATDLYAKQLGDRADYYFFDNLFDLLDKESDERKVKQNEFLEKLFIFAKELIDEAAMGLPKKSIHHLRNYNDAMKYFFGRKKKKLSVSST